MQASFRFGLVALLSGCGTLVPAPGLDDFSARLANGYFVFRNSAHQIHVSRNGDSSAGWIPNKVVQLDHDEVWVIAKQQHLRRRSPGDPKDTYEEPDPGVFSYWILNMKKAKSWGPLNYDEFKSLRRELEVPSRLWLHNVYDYEPRGSEPRFQTQ